MTNHTGGVRAADGRHLDDLPIEQLDAIVLVQDAQLSKPVVGVHSEGTRKQANRHVHNMDSAKWSSQFCNRRSTSVGARMCYRALALSKDLGFGDRNTCHYGELVDAVTEEPLDLVVNALSQEHGIINARDGDFPPRAVGLVLAWARLHRVELAENWERARAGEPLRRIPPLE